MAQINGIMTGGAFCHDFGALTVMGIEESAVIKYTIYGHAGTIAEFTEVYYADSAKKIVIYGLGELVKSYFQNKIYPDWMFETLLLAYDMYLDLSIEITDASGGEKTTVTQRFYYCNCRTKLRPAQYKGFLSRYTERWVREDQPLCIGYTAAGQEIHIGVMFWENDATRYERFDLGASSSGDMAILSVSVAAIVQHLSEETGNITTPDKVIYYDLMLENGGTMINRIRMNIDRRHYPQLQFIIYTNCFGVLDSCYLTGKDTRSSELNGIYSTVKGEYNKISTNLITSHASNTGYIEDVERDAMEDLAKSDNVYLYEPTGDETGIGDRITITEIDFKEERPYSAPIRLQITWRVANCVNQLFARECNTKSFRIFSRTFDKTFN